jgi:hypothetical protein
MDGAPAAAPRGAVPRGRRQEAGTDAGDELVEHEFDRFVLLGEFEFHGALFQM